MILSRAFLSAALATVAASAAAQTAPSTPETRPVEQKAERLPGYLRPEAVPDVAVFLPPKPADNSATEQRDFAVFMETRKLQGTPRWELATRDAVETPAAFLADFSCALGVTLTPDNAPALAHLLQRAGADESAIVSRAKAVFKRLRPFVGNAQPICVARSDALAKSPSYPSGHTTAAWSLGLILAQIAPDRASQVLARARSYGESRVVCGVHFVSDIEEGRTTGSALVAALQADPAFQADLAAARRELATLRAKGTAPEADSCKVQDEAAAHTPWEG